MVGINTEHYWDQKLKTVPNCDKDGYWSIQTMDKINKLAKGKVLELGFGVGGILRELSKKNLEHVVGIEISGWACEHMASYPNVETIKMELKKDRMIPFVNDYFDMVIFLHTAEHLPQDDLMWINNEIKRVLKNDGLLIVEVPDSNGCNEHFITFHDEDTIKKHFNFNILSIEKTNRHSWLVVMKNGS